MSWGKVLPGCSEHITVYSGDECGEPHVLHWGEVRRGQSIALVRLLMKKAASKERPVGLLEGSLSGNRMKGCLRAVDKPTHQSSFPSWKEKQVT